MFGVFCIIHIFAVAVKMLCRIFETIIKVIIKVCSKGDIIGFLIIFYVLWLN